MNGSTDITEYSTPTKNLGIRKCPIAKTKITIRSIKHQIF